MGVCSFLAQTVFLPTGILPKGTAAVTGTQLSQALNLTAL